MKCLTIVTLMFAVGLLYCVSAQSYSQGVKVAMDFLKQKCESNGVDNQTVVVARRVMQKCLTNLINIFEVQNEIDIAKPHGVLDEVFIKYCKKKTDVLGCISNFVDDVEPCFKAEEQSNAQTLKNITESLLVFICDAEGNRIAMFISEGGPECLQNNSKGIQGCFNTTFGSYNTATILNAGNASSLDDVDNHATLIADDKTCNDIQTVQNCVVGELETCQNPTTANVVDSLMRYMIRNTPCRSEVSSASITVHSFPITIVFLMFTICMK